VTAEELEILLLVQERDTALDRLRHRRATLPERAQLEALESELRAQQAQHAAVQAQQREVHAEERRLDDEARTIRAHADDAEKKLYAGTTSSPRELQAMQADVDMLKRHVSDIEDRELEVMEAREKLDGEVTAVEAAIATADAAAQVLRDAIAVSETEIDAETTTEAAARADLAQGVSEALLNNYERRRTQNKGAGAARLVGNTCQACHLTIPSTEAERIRRGAGAEVDYCDNCGAILVP
jgi:predicted  nucleic acid-binding Zn-ribbon protein